MSISRCCFAIAVFTAQLTWAGYSPTKTEVNLGPVPIDLYFSTNGSTLPNCPSTYTIRQCIKLFFNNNSGSSPYSSDNYVGQGVTGVRFMFGVMGGGNSTAWDSSGNVRSTWVTNLSAFLSDLYSFGIVRVTPTPSLDGWGQPTNTITLDSSDCSGASSLYFYRWLPWGYAQANPAVPECSGNNNGYSTANGNYNPGHTSSNFWGWSPLFNLVNTVMSSVYSAGLQLREFDLNNEFDILDYTVSARLIYDNTTSTDVLGTLRGYASNYGFDPYAVTYSEYSYNSTVSGYHCGSVYGDSASILAISELTGALAGGGGLFGAPSGVSVTNGLFCGGSTSPMIYLPVSYTQPDVTDIHIYPCVLVSAFGACDTSTDATTAADVIYSDVWSFLSYRSLTGNTMVVGETMENQYCDGETPTLASQNVAGYKNSTLYSNISSATVMRPWNNETGSCYAAPAVINPPYDSLHP